jgi:hypothetical protein
MAAQLFAGVALVTVMVMLQLGAEICAVVLKKVKGWVWHSPVCAPEW